MAAIHQTFEPGTDAGPLGRLSPRLALAALFWAGNSIAGRALGGAVVPAALNAPCWGRAAPWMLPLLWRHRRAVRREQRHLLALGAAGVAGFQAVVHHALGTTAAVSALVMVALTPGAILAASAATAGARRAVALGARRWCSRGGASTRCRRSRRATAGRCSRWRSGRPARCSCGAGPRGRRRASRWPARSRPGRRSSALLWTALRADRPAMLPSDPAAWGAALRLSLFASLAAFACWSRGVEAPGPARASAYPHLMPLLGTALAVLVPRETLAPAQVVGGAMVLGAPAWGGTPSGARG